MLLGALIGYRCSLGRCRDLVLVGPLEVLVLTGHGCRNSTGAAARSCMQRPHPDEVMVARRPASGYGCGGECTRHPRSQASELLIPPCLIRCH